MKVDPERLIAYPDQTGIYVRAQLPDGSWKTVDIATLDKESFVAWCNEGFARTVRLACILIGHS